MLTKTVLGRKTLNAMIRLMRFNGHVEMPCPYRQHLEHAVLKQLQVDGKIVSTRNGRGEVILVLKDSELYHEEPASQLGHPIEPLVVHLALENPRNEHLAKVFRKNHAVPALPEYSEVELSLDNGDF
jgi:hypothetical protein